MTPILLALLLTQADDPASKLRELDAKVLPAEQPRMIGRDARARIEEANRKSSESWGKADTREKWESFAAARVRDLRASLNLPENLPRQLDVKVTRKLDGDGFLIENLVFESRPGLLVTANLYVPVPERQSMPGILIIHSHHSPKTQSELQDMGMTWARQGCYVLVMDQIGHGERRQHPFIDASSYPGSFRVGRQDYWFRYMTGMQLYLVGESLIGWMAWDLMRGVDLLLARTGIDAKRIILLGSVAGGGDPAGVTAAIDLRIAAVVPFNFGGPQPETRYPLPEDAETSFNYAGGGSWESTRNLRLSARDGFLPWVIVGSVAPRRLVHAHEFAWDRERDPVWKRYQKIYGFYGEPGGVAAAQGRGAVTGQAPESTHCNNIGAVHRQGIYPALEKWFKIPAPEKETTERRPSADLLCLTPELKPRKVHELALEGAQGARPKLDVLRRHWWDLLGDIAPPRDAKVTAGPPRKVGDISVESLTIEPEPGIVLPLLLLIPPREADAKLPLVIGISQGGKQDFLKKRSDEVAALLKGGAAVCLPDLRGCGETRAGESGGRGSERTSVAATELMLGRTLLGLRVRDLRSVIHVIARRTELDSARMALWGDATAPVNPPERRFDVPLDADKAPVLSEPLGGLAALFGALFEESIRVLYIRGGLASYRSLLESPFVYAPFDVIVPGAAKLTDLGETLAALPLRAVRLEDMVDGWNRRMTLEALTRSYTPAMVATEEAPAAWLLKSLGTR